MTPDATNQRDDELQPTNDAADGDAAPAEGAAAPEIDLDALDLSVETAEERISPSETNVFDK